MSENKIDYHSAVDNMSLKIFEEFSSSSKSWSSPKIFENSILILSCFGTCLPSFAYNHIENIIKLLKEFAIHGENEWIQYGGVVGLGIISSVLQITDKIEWNNIITYLIQIMKENDSSWVKFGCGCSLGLIVSSLFQQKTNKEEDIASISQFQEELFNKIYNFLNDHLQDNKEIIYENRWDLLGRFIGLLYIIPVMEILKKYNLIESLYIQFWAHLKNINIQEDVTSSSFYVGCSLVISSLIPHAFRLNLISSSEIFNCITFMDQLLEKIKSYPIYEGICLAFSTLIHSLLIEGYNFPPNFIEKRIDQMCDILLSKNTITSSKIGCAMGLANILGAFLIIPNPKVCSPLDNFYLSSKFLNNTSWSKISEKIIVTLKESLENDFDPRVCRYV